MERNLQRSFFSLHFERRVENTIAIQYTAGVGLWRIESSCKAFRRVFHGDAPILLDERSSGNSDCRVFSHRFARVELFAFSFRVGEICTRAMKQHILVVDDEPPIRQLLGSYFAKHGYEVITAADATEAFAKADNVPLNLVILDVLLPDTDGLEILEKLKSAHPNLPIIIMTGIGFDEELLQESIQKGASGYISKTLPLDQLLIEVHRTLKFKTPG